MGKSRIEWTEATWNPLVGCSIATPGCTNCYAMKMASRREAMNAGLRDGHGAAAHYAGTTHKVKGRAVWTGKLALAPNDTLLTPLRRKKPTTYFVNSMGDLFHEDAPDHWIDLVFAIMALAPQHTFQVLTKRAERMQRYLNDPHVMRRIFSQACDTAIESDLNVVLIPNPVFEAVAPPGPRIHLDVWPLRNVWLGVSTERQQEADARIPELLLTPAAVRFISAEPLLGPIDLERIKMRGIVDRFDALYGSSWTQLPDGTRFYATSGAPKIDWVIVGGESGREARPTHPDWVRSLRDQCAAANVAFFFKQWGEWLPIIDRDRDDPDWRKDYSREFPDNGATKWLNVAGGCGFHGDRFHVLRRVGKAAAGHILDGRVNQAVPELRQ